MCIPGVNDNNIATGFMQIFSLNCFDSSSDTVLKDQFITIQEKYAGHECHRELKEFSADDVELAI